MSCWPILRSCSTHRKTRWYPGTFYRICDRIETNPSVLTAFDLRGRREFANSPRCQCSNCPNHDACAGVDCRDIVVRDQVILGWADHDIKLDCLIEKGPNASLEEVMAFVESKESGIISLLNGGSDATAPVNSFRKQQRGIFKQQTPPIPLLTPTCTHCGKVGHGSSRDERSDNCSAYRQSCTKCGKHGDFAADTKEYHIHPKLVRASKPGG